MTNPADQVRTDASRFDDASLEHLANKGLVRRSKKLVAGESSIAVVATETGCSVAGADWLVEFTAGQPLQDARCGCSTAGVCQHLLASIMELREASGTDPAVDDSVSVLGVDADAIEQFLLAVTDEQLLKWAKTADSRWAASRVEALDVDQVVVDKGDYLSVELPTPHPNGLFMGDSLDQAIVKPSGRHDRRAVALGVLALWKVNGRTFRPPVTKSNAPINELVAERTSVLDRSERLAEDFLTMGLLHIADPEAERIGSLASSLRGVKLYRLAGLAERVADQVDALAELSITADTGRLLEQLAELSVVAQATKSRMVDGVALPEGLVGTARAQYETVGHLELIGIGDYAWSNARFAGTTTVVAQSASQIYSVFTTTEANGRTLSNNSGWSGVGSIGAVTGNAFVLANAQASSAARLSSSDKATATLSHPASTADIGALAWDGTPPAAGSRLLGYPTSSWVVCRVEQVHAPAAFDMVEQEVVWRIESVGHDVVVRLPYSETSPAVENLERFAGGGSSSFFAKSKKPIDYVVGRLRGSTTVGFDLWPISVVSGGRLINLADPLGKRATAVRSSPAEVPESEPFLPVTQIERLQVEITRLAEGGSRAATSEAMGQLSRQAEQAGLSIIATAIVNSPSAHVALLRAAWIIELAKESDG